MTPISAQQYREAVDQKPKRRNKYHAQKTEIDGITFDSKAEAAYYSKLQLRAKAREVHHVELQVPFPLTVNGYLVGSYRADFVFYDDVETRQRVIDVKGYDTPLSKLKRKLVKAIHGVDVEIVR